MIPHRTQLTIILAYVDEIYETMVKTPQEELEKIETELKKETPEPLHTMLTEKQSKNDAIDATAPESAKSMRIVHLCVQVAINN